MKDHIHAPAAFIPAPLAYDDVKTLRARLDLMKKRESFDPAKKRTTIPRSSFPYPSTRTEFQYVALLHCVRSILCNCFLR